MEHLATIDGRFRVIVSAENRGPDWFKREGEVPDLVFHLDRH